MLDGPATARTSSGCRSVPELRTRANTEAGGEHTAGERHGWQRAPPPCAGRELHGMFARRSPEDIYHSSKPTIQADFPLVFLINPYTLKLI